MLSRPENLQLDNYFIRWDKVDNATSYKLIINGHEYTVVEPFFDIKDFINGEYVVKVRAINPKFTDSVYSKELKFTLKDDIYIPSDFKISNDIIEWSLDKEAMQYVVSINDIEYYCYENKYDLRDLNINQVYFIKVKAVYRHSESEYSESIVYHTYQDVYQSIDDVNFDKNSTNDLTIDMEEDFVIDKLVLYNKEIDYLYQNNALKINCNILSSVEYGNNLILVFTNKGIVEINVDVYDSREPFLISDYYVAYEEGKDVKFEFELYSCKIGELSGSGITTEDYIIKGNKLIIKHQFLTKAFNEKSRKTIALGYYLYNNENIIIKYLFINKN